MNRGAGAAAEAAPITSANPPITTTQRIGTSVVPRYGRNVDGFWKRARSASSLVRICLVLFVLVWLFGPPALRSAIPIWLPFLVALGVEVHFFVGSQRGPAGRSRRDRAPQPIDRERFGYTADTDELVLVRRDGEEFWIPYAGATPDEIDVEEALAPTPYVPERRENRPIRRFLVGVGVIAAIATIAWVVESQRGWNGLGRDTRAAAEERFSAEASRVAGHRVEIRCDEAGEHVGAVQHADGVAVVGGRLAYLTPERCYELYRLAFEGEVSFSRTARAVAVLAHEAWHLAGVRDEGTTECYALQSGVELGQRLGLAEKAARRMMRQQLVENARRVGAASEYHVPPECRDGGRLDRNPESSEFP
ncbi:MAG: hypothetical protein M3229_02750 [Actinomycetota bacterium]|nr:hypothetical protein [Actinomycetota bacterium]